MQTDNSPDHRQGTALSSIPADLCRSKFRTLRPSMARDSRRFRSSTSLLGQGNNPSPAPSAGLGSSPLFYKPVESREVVDRSGACGTIPSISKMRNKRQHHLTNSPDRPVFHGSYVNEN